MSFLVFLFWISSFLILYSYVFYPLLLIVLDRMFPWKEPNYTKELPPVSLIICAYNEEKVIRQKIENCFSIDYPSDMLEVIVASDGSDDQTVHIAEEYLSKGVVLYDYKERRGKVNVLNETIQKAKHNILVLTDANTMFKRNAVKNLVRHFGNKQVGCVCGGLQFVNVKGSQTGELEGIYWKYETILKKLEGRRGALLGANGAIYALRKDIFEPCPSDMIVEDFYIPMKLLQRGFQVIYDPEAMALEEATHKIIHEKERRIRIGAGDFQALFRLLPMLSPLKGFPSVAFWSHKVFRWFAPFLLIAAFVTNFFLIDLQHPVYIAAFIVQFSFYIFAMIGQLLSLSGKKMKPFSLCYYFVSMNLALLLGFFRFLSNNQSVAWRRTER